MSRSDRERWERKHAAAGPSETDEPDPAVSTLPRAVGDQIVLDLACGRGRNTMALAASGYRVVAADIAKAALVTVRDRALTTGARVHPVQVDFDAWPFAADVFDGVVQCAFLDRRLFASIKASVRTGGFVLIDTFMAGTVPNASGPTDPDFLLRPGELPSVFGDWHISEALEYGSSTLRSRIVARKV